MSDDRAEEPPWRPFVTMNVATSADGKLTPRGQGKVSFGSVEDRAQMEALRVEADGVIIGSGTLLAEDPPLVIRDADLRARRIAAKGSPHPRNITVCSTLPAQLAEMNFFRNSETEKIVFTTESSSSEILATAAQFAHVEVVPRDDAGRVDLTEVVRRIHALGIRHLLLEGGGELNFSMLNAGLVDEMYMTFCPFVFGGRDAPTAFDGEGFSRDCVRKLALKSHRLGSRGELFLRYEVLPGTAHVTPSRMFPDAFELS